MLAIIFANSIYVRSLSAQVCSRCLEALFPVTPHNSFGRFSSVEADFIDSPEAERCLWKLDLCLLHLTLHCPEGQSLATCGW